MQIFSIGFKIQLLVILILNLIIICNSSSIPNIFGVSPSFGHQEIRDAHFDLIDMNKCPGSINSCDSIQEGNQSIDISAIDYFSDSKFLNVTLWLRSTIKNLSLEHNDIPSYGIFIDADSNNETGWQGIDYQMEIVWNDGTWNNTLIQISSTGYPRILKQENQTTEESYELGKNYVITAIDLAAIGSPEKYKVMFYVEDKKRDKSIWKTDFSSWIDIPTPELILSTTPDTIELRPDITEVIGIQLISNSGSTPEVSNYTIKDNGQSSIHAKVLNESRNNMEPASVEINIPHKITTGKYAIPVQANITQRSTIPNLPLQQVNLGYNFEEKNLPVTILKSLTWYENGINFWIDWGSPIAFIGGIITGKLGSAFLEFLKNRLRKRNNEGAN